MVGHGLGTSLLILLASLACTTTIQAVRIKGITTKIQSNNDHTHHYNPRDTTHVLDSQYTVAPEVLSRWRATLERLPFVGMAGMGGKGGDREAGYIPPTIPDDVTCNKTQFCDINTSICVDVCGRGTVQVSPWLQYAHETQRNLSRTQPLCYTQMPGTHNSAITMADGYGSEDAYWTSLLQKYFPEFYLRTNDQFLSITDQMNLGVRVVELDTHYFDKKLHLAHCGGAHFKELDKVLREIASALHINITWDSETIGCDPSLSAIPTTQQRTLEEGFQEISAWLNLPEHKNEFLMIYFDDQADLLTWGVVPELLALITKYFGNRVWTPADKVKFNPDNGTWPSIDQMVSMGKNVLFMSGTDYGPIMQPLVFVKKSAMMCNWQEPDVDKFTPYPDCHVNDNTTTTYNGTIYRIETSQIVYGPYYSNQPGSFLDKNTIPPLVKCAVNFLCPDLFTPTRSTAEIWTWDEGEPIVKGNGTCAIVGGDNGRWRATTCASVVPVACRTGSGAVLGSTWKIAVNGTCPAGSTFAAPVNGLDNARLTDAINAAGQSSVKISYQPL